MKHLAALIIISAATYAGLTAGDDELGVTIKMIASGVNAFVAGVYTTLNYQRAKDRP